MPTGHRQFRHFVFALNFCLAQCSTRGFNLHSPTRLRSAISRAAAAEHFSYYFSYFLKRCAVIKMALKFSKENVKKKTWVILKSCALVASILFLYRKKIGEREWIYRRLYSIAPAAKDRLLIESFFFLWRNDGRTDGCIKSIYIDASIYGKVGAGTNARNIRREYNDRAFNLNGMHIK